MIKLYHLIALTVCMTLAAAHEGIATTPDNPLNPFDVIILTNGEIIHGKVVEVGIELIRYQRTDIPDGPVYEIFRSEVFAISYRNQVTEYFAPHDEKDAYYQGIGEPEELRDTPEHIPEEEDDWYAGLQHGELRIGLGAIRNHTMIREVEDFRSESGFPGFYATYVFPALVPGLNVGVSVGLASYNYSDRRVSEYDRLITDRDIRESLFSIAAVGKYSLGIDFLSPYLLGGLGYANSNVRSDGIVTFTDTDRAVSVQGGARSGEPLLIMRAGTDVRITDEVSAFLDIGTGFALIQFGGVFKIGNQ